MSPRYKCPECNQHHGGYRASPGAVSTICQSCYRTRLAALKPVEPAPKPKSPTRTKSKREGS